MIDKLIYICHEYGGKEENRQKVEALIKSYRDLYPNYCFISPIHAFGFLYDTEDYDSGMECCLTLLDLCDEMWAFGSYSNSRGCLIEKEYCTRYKIPIIEKAVK